MTYYVSIEYRGHKCPEKVRVFKHVEVLRIFFFMHNILMIIFPYNNSVAYIMF